MLMVCRFTIFTVYLQCVHTVIFSLVLILLVLQVQEIQIMAHLKFDLIIVQEKCE